MSFLIYQILQLKEFMLTACILGAFTMLFFLVLAARPKRGPADYGIQAFFLHRTWRETVYMSCSILQGAFALSCLVCRTQLSTAHLLLAGSLCVVKAVMLPNAVSFLTDVLYTSFLIAALLAANLLAGFMQQVSSDIWLRAVYWLLQIFILEYALYDCVHSFQVMLGKETLFARSRVRRQKRKKKKMIQKELEEPYG